MHKLMDVTVDHARLLAAISTASSIAERRADNGALKNVLIDADPKHGIVVTATDLRLTSRETLDVRVDTTVESRGKVSVPAHHLLSVVKTLPPGPVRVQGAENNWVHLSARRSSFKLMACSPSDFPDPPAVPNKGFVGVHAVTMHSMLESTLKTASTDESRVNLNGVLFESDGKVGTSVSTDGHRLTKVSLAMAGLKLARGVVIPRHGVVALLALLKQAKAADVMVHVDDASQWLTAQGGALTLSIKLNNVVFPPYQQVIPRAFKREAIVDRASLATVLSRAIVMAPEKTATARLDFIAKDNLLQVTADNPDLGQVTDAVEMEFSGEGLTAGYNAVYLLDVLATIKTAKVVLRLGGELEPMVVQPVDGPDYLCVVMPMRI